MASHEQTLRGKILPADHELLARGTARPDVFEGEPTMRDMRISVKMVLSPLTQGISPEAILDNYLDLKPDNTRPCAAYAHISFPEIRWLQAWSTSHETPGGWVRRPPRNFSATGEQLGFHAEETD